MMLFDFGQISKLQWSLLLILLLAIFFIRIVPNVIHTDYIDYYSDSIFHRTLVERIKTNQPLNSEITLNFTENPMNITNFTWNEHYVTTYPKAFHYFVAILPFQTDLSLAIADGLFFILLLFGIFLLSYVLSESFYNGLLAVCLFMMLPMIFAFFLGNLYYGNYLIPLLFMTYAQLVINAIGLYFIVAILYVLSKYKEIIKTGVWAGMIVAIFLLVIVNCHNIYYPGLDVIKENQRFVPMILSVLLPFLSSFVPKRHAKIYSLMMLPICVMIVISLNMTAFSESHIWQTRLIGG